MILNMDMGRQLLTGCSGLSEAIAKMHHTRSKTSKTFSFELQKGLRRARERGNHHLTLLEKVFIQSKSKATFWAPTGAVVGTRAVSAAHPFPD